MAETAERAMPAGRVATGAAVAGPVAGAVAAVPRVGRAGGREGAARAVAGGAIWVAAAAWPVAVAAATGVEAWVAAKVGRR